MNNLKEQLQENALTWYEGLSKTKIVTTQDMDTLCEIIIETINANCDLEK